jgi:hypothetical protein
MRAQFDFEQERWLVVESEGYASIRLLVRGAWLSLATARWDGEHLTDACFDGPPCLQLLEAAAAALRGRE